MIFRAFLLAIGQLGDPRFRRVLLLGVGLALALLVGITALMLVGIAMLVGDATTLPLIGTVSWVDDILSWGAVMLMLALSTFLMIPVASAITSMMLEEVAQAVEDRHYPHLSTAQAAPIGDQIRDTVNFLGVLLAANVFAIVLYLLLPFFAPLIFWTVNGALLAREYFTLVAARHIPRDEAKALRKRHRFTLLSAGFVMAVPLTIPLVNLLIPILGAATFTHIFHRLYAPDAIDAPREI